MPKDVGSVCNCFTVLVSLETETKQSKLHPEFCLLTVIDEACIRVSVSKDSEAVAYRADVLWHYIETEFLISGSQCSKFHYLARIARLVLTLPHISADEERVFSRINKNKTKFHDSLSLDRTLPSVVTVQMNRSADEPCYEFEV